MWPRFLQTGIKKPTIWSHTVGFHERRATWGHRHERWGHAGFKSALTVYCGSWMNNFTSLSLNFFLHKMGTMQCMPRKVVVRIKSVNIKNTSKVFRTVCPTSQVLAVINNPNVHKTEEALLNWESLQYSETLKTEENWGTALEKFCSPRPPFSHSPRAPSVAHS